MVQCCCQMHRQTITSATRRAHVARTCDAPPPETDRAHWRDRVCAHAQAGWSLQAAAGMSEHGLAPKEKSFSLMQCPFKEHEPTTTSAERRARSACARGAPPPEREIEQWRNRVRAHAQAGWSFEAAAGTSEHGLEPNGRGSSLVQCSLIERGMTTTSAARGAWAASARAAPPPKKEIEQWRDRVCAHAQAGWSLEAAAPQLARRSTALHRRIEAVRWCSVIAKCTDRP